jgi:hypothetical protein
MTREDIVRMAREVETVMTGHDFPHSDEFIEWCERFAALVAAAERDKNKELWESLQFSDEKISNCIEAAVAAERDACAKVCDAQIEEWVDDRPRYAASECAAAIRARGEE